MVPTNATTEQRSDAIASAEYFPVGSAFAGADLGSGSGGRCGRGAGCVIGFGAGANEVAGTGGGGGGAAAAVLSPGATAV
jgi:hypothetical protein